MAFKFAARTLLELGKELISSDEVALYELIKNSVDAKSPNVEIDFNICLLKSDYDKAIEQIEDEYNYIEIRKFVLSRLLIDANEGDLEDFKLDLEDASDIVSFHQALTQAYAQYNYIEVRDTGKGMSVADLNEIYLVVGTRSKRKENLLGAAHLGDKGVGRLSAMRLGDRLQVFTCTQKDTHLNILDIDWSLFGHDIEKEVGDIEIDPYEGRVKNTPDEQGTTIHISFLNSNWSYARVEDMLNGAIARMVDPFQPGRGNELLKVTHNRSPLIVPSIPALLLRAAHATCKATFEFDKHGEPVFSGQIDYKYRNTKAYFNQQGAELLSVTQKGFKQRGKKGHASVSYASIRPEALKELGPFEVEIYWYNRKVVESISGLTEKVRETKDLIAAWAGGVMLYRNGYRVLPYGEPDDDWLELDKKAFGGSGFLLNRQQLLGKVTVHSDHKALSEQTNREGLIQSEPADALISILMWLMHVEFRSVIKTANDEDLELRKIEQRDSLLNYESKHSELLNRFAELTVKFPENAKDELANLKSSINDIVQSCAVAIESTEKVMESVINEREQFVYLAGIGLMTEFIFHELDRAITHTTNSLSDTRKIHPNDAALASLEQQLITLQKRVSAFDEMTGEKRQSKSKLDVADVLKTVLASHQKEFERHQIKVELYSNSLELKAVKGMLIQILENLISNSAYWLKQQAKVERGFSPKLIIKVNPNSKTIEISDNGPGVSEDRKERIFEAFVTSKPAGQGRGLGLYICREMAVYHNWTLAMDNNLGEFRSDRLNTFVLDFKG